MCRAVILRADIHPREVLFSYRGGSPRIIQGSDVKDRRWGVSTWYAA